MNGREGYAETQALQGGSCASGSCASGSCASGSCTSGPCGRGPCGRGPCGRGSCARGSCGRGSRDRSRLTRRVVGAGDFTEKNTTCCKGVDYPPWVNGHFRAHYIAMLHIGCVTSLDVMRISLSNLVDLGRPDRQILINRIFARGRTSRSFLGRASGGKRSAVPFWVIPICAFDLGEIRMALGSDWDSAIVPHARALGFSRSSVARVSSIGRVPRIS